MSIVQVPDISSRKTLQAKTNSEDLSKKVKLQSLSLWGSNMSSKRLDMCKKLSLTNLNVRRGDLLYPFYLLALQPTDNRGREKFLKNISELSK